MSDRKVNDRPTGFPMSDYEHWLLENAKDMPWTESGGPAIIRDLVDLADRAVDSAAEITRLRAIVDKLPKTADGVVIELGQTVWCVLDSGLWSAPVDSIEYGRCWVHKPEVWAGYVEYRDCYSTREAAEAAQHPNGGRDE